MKVTVIVISLFGHIYPFKGSILNMLSWNKNKSSWIAFRIVLYFLVYASSALFLLLSKNYLGSTSYSDEESLISWMSYYFWSRLLIVSRKSINSSAYYYCNCWYNSSFLGFYYFYEQNALHSKFTFTFDLFIICNVCCDWSPI